MNIFIMALLILGGLLIVAGSTGLPSLREKRLLGRVGKSPHGFDFEKTIVMPLANRIGSLIRLSAYNRERLEAELAAAGFQMTPEAYTARAFVVSGIYMIVALLLIITGFVPFRIVGGLLFIAAIIQYFRIKNEVGDRLRHKREAIGEEAPQFMRTITQSLLYTRDILGIVDKYRLTAGPQLRAELDILVTDMKTGNHEQALLAFARRVQIDYVTTFVTGLVSQSKGIDQTEFLRSTENEMKRLSIEKMKAEAFKKPEKLRTAQFILLVNLVAAWLIAIGLQIFTQFANLQNF